MEFYPPRKQLIINDLYSFITVYFAFFGLQKYKNFLKNNDYERIICRRLRHCEEPSLNMACPRGSDLW